MRRRTFLWWAACLVCAGSAVADDAPSTSAKDATTPVVQQAAFVSKPLNGRMRQQAQDRLSAALINKHVTSRIDYPAYKDGVDVFPSGKWSSHDAKQLIEDHGIGVVKGGNPTITAVKLKDKHIEFHLDGGGAGMFSEGFGPDPSEEKDKVPGGSRINLRFGRAITSGDLLDLERLVALLEPVADTAELRATLASTFVPPPDPPVAAVTAPKPGPASKPATASAPKPAPEPKTGPSPEAAPQPVATASMAGMAAPGLVDPKAAPAKAQASAKAQAPAKTPAPAPTKAAAPAPATPPVTASPAPAAQSTAKKDVASIKITAGMDKREVFALLGQPGYKRVDVSKAVPVEMWQYNLAGESKRIVTFENGIVTKIEDF